MLAVLVDLRPPVLTRASLLPITSQHRRRDKQARNDDALGKHHASRAVRRLRSQCFECCAISLAHDHSIAQQEFPGTPDRAAWIGGHGTEPYEQNTQQSPAFGRRVTPQPVQM